MTYDQNLSHLKIRNSIFETSERERELKQAAEKLLFPDLLFASNLVFT